jgi:hypothetical protein
LTDDRHLGQNESGTWMVCVSSSAIPLAGGVYGAKRYTDSKYYSVYTQSNILRNCWLCINQQWLLLSPIVPLKARQYTGPPYVQISF